jgi:hypothetical protein
MISRTKISKNGVTMKWLLRKRDHAPGLDCEFYLPDLPEQGRKYLIIMCKVRGFKPAWYFEDDLREWQRWHSASTDMVVSTHGVRRCESITREELGKSVRYLIRFGRDRAGCWLS